MPKRNPDKGFNVHERMILVTLDRANRPLSQRQISEKCGMAWRTTNEYITQLEGKGYVHCKPVGNKKMCELKIKSSVDKLLGNQTK